MNIAWVSPLVARSAIGRESIRVTDALAARGHKISLIGCEAQLPEEPLHQTDLAVSHWTEVDLKGLATAADIVVVNVGDHYPYHGGIFDILAAAPCLGIFHDFYLYDLFFGWIEATGQPRAWVEHEIVRTYGSWAAPSARRARHEQMSQAELAASFPMTEWVARRCAGALAHSPFYLDRLSASCPGPLDVAALPVAARGVPPLEPRPERQALVAITVGMMNRNKCADQVIAAIAGSPHLRTRMAYRLVGPVVPQERARLTALAQSLDYQGLTITGPVDEAQLTAELKDADIICCLREPVLEGASGSAVEGLLSGRPVVVADAGFYHDLPDELVFKVPAQVAPAALRAQLERLAADEPLRRRVGAAACAWAGETFDLTRYVEVLEPLMAATIEAAPALGLGARLGRELHALGLSGDDAAIQRIADLLDPLVGGP